MPCLLRTLSVFKSIILANFWSKFEISNRWVLAAIVVGPDRNDIFLTKSTQNSGYYQYCVNFRCRVSWGPYQSSRALFWPTFGVSLKSPTGESWPQSWKVRTEMTYFWQNPPKTRDIINTVLIPDAVSPEDLISLQEHCFGQLLV